MRFFLSMLEAGFIVIMAISKCTGQFTAKSNALKDHKSQESGTLATLLSNSKTVTRWVDKRRLSDGDLKATSTLLSVLTQVTQLNIAFPTVAAAVSVVVGVVADDVSLHVRL